MGWHDAPPPARDHRLSVAVDRDTAQKIRQIAAGLGTTISALMRELAETAIAEHDQGIR